MSIIGPAGWSMNNPILNGKAIPSAFHFNHPEYDKLIEESLNYLVNYDIITENMTRAELYSKMNQFRQFMSAKLDDAINAATNDLGQFDYKINEYFRQNRISIFDEFINYIN